MIVEMRRQLAILIVLIVAVLQSFSFCLVQANGTGSTTQGDAGMSAEALAYKQQGDIYQQQGQLDQAIAAYTRALQINPQYAGAYYNRGSAYSKKGQSEQATADYRAALRIDPQLPATYQHWSADDTRKRHSFPLSVSIGVILLVLLFKCGCQQRNT